MYYMTPRPCREDEKPLSFIVVHAGSSNSAEGRKIRQIYRHAPTLCGADVCSDAKLGISPAKTVRIYGMLG